MAAIVEEPRASVRLEIEGMTCASGATRIARRLNGLGGVETAVNLATEQISVASDPWELDVPQPVAAVASVGYHASLSSEAPGDSAVAADKSHELLGGRTIVKMR